MKCLLILSLFFFGGGQTEWKVKKEKGFSLYYQSVDAADKKIYTRFYKTGIRQVRSFFGQDYKTSFSVYVHPSRSSLDSTWRIDWKAPDFRSECWMVASGISGRVDMLSPRQWSSSACEHDDKDKKETQALITHELVHVFHGQYNASSDFSAVEGMDWFVEGLAAYASGQVSEEKLKAVTTALKENKIPASLQNFWTGKLRYPLSGSVVRYIDLTWGRKKLVSLLTYANLADLLRALETTEEKLMAGWKAFMLQ
jgi:hypothetical protein